MGVYADLVEEVSDTFRRDDRLAGFGERLGVIDLLLVERRQHPGADTNECGVRVVQIPRDVDAVVFRPHKKDLRRGQGGSPCSPSQCRASRQGACT